VKYVQFALGTARGSTGDGMLDRLPVSALTSSVAISGVSPREAPDLDARLVDAIRAGDRTAEERLYRRHAPSILRLATRLLRSHEDAMDVLQDTFVTAYEEIGDLRDGSAFRAWLHRVAVRLVHRRFRRRKLLGLLGLDRRGEEIPLESLADDSASPEARMELRWLDEALRAIDERSRIAWMLRHVEGLSLEETAIACECSLATVKRRIAASEALVNAHLTGGAG
jgi:RNA polymerase sigma-70 factor, ECF subfamily